MDSKLKIDVRSALAGLDYLAGPLQESLLRRMLVAGGRIIRDQAKVNARAHRKWNYNPESRGSHQHGTLAEAIYLARDTEKSTSYRFVYKISWNAHKAWWGKLVEFPHFKRYFWFKDENGVYHTSKQFKLDTPIMVEAHPFLFPAFTARLADARAAMLRVGSEELPKLLAQRVNIVEVEHV